MPELPSLQPDPLPRIWLNAGQRVRGSRQLRMARYQQHRQMCTRLLLARQRMTAAMTHQPYPVST